MPGARQKRTLTFVDKLDDWQPPPDLKTGRAMHGLTVLPHSLPPLHRQRGPRLSPCTRAPQVPTPQRGQARPSQSSRTPSSRS
eukprot:7228165-Pyramimonas_sp.AAC.1